jgi:protease-4
MRSLWLWMGLLLALGGCGVPSLLITPVSSSTRLEETELRPGQGWAPAKIVIVEVEGMLLNARTGGLLQPTENDLSLFVQELEKAQEDPRVAAVVLRVNSPGGTVTTSDVMYQQVLKFRQKTGRPVIAAAQDVTASGAYYVCCGADRIVVHPTSVVGSIGVIFNAFDISGLMAKVGLRNEAVKSGSLKDMGSPLRPLEQQERRLMQEMVDEYFMRFAQIVRQHRPIKEAPLASAAAYQKPEYQGIFSGRVFSGEQAVALGLADQTGTLDDAIELARQLAKAPKAKVVHYRRPYGYSGSIYAAGPTPPPSPGVIHLNIPPTRAMLPTGFYYLWEP